MLGAAIASRTPAGSGIDALQTCTVVRFRTGTEPLAPVGRIRFGERPCPACRMLLRHDNLLKTLLVLVEIIERGIAVVNKKIPSLPVDLAGEDVWIERRFVT